MLIADKSHIGSLETNRDRPTFTAEQIIAIYEAAGRSTDLDTLKAQARVLFPHILEGGEPPLWRTEGVGRAFRMEDGSCVKPVWRLGSNYCRDVGILPDGTARIY